jgi:large subunit ribosomal protein L23
MAINILKKTATDKVAAGKGKKEENKDVAVKTVPAGNLKDKNSGSAWCLLRNAHVTEKATDLSAYNQYIFNVYPRSNKTEIKKAVETTYGVEVVFVNIVNIPPKKRRLGKHQGWRPAYKKAIVGVKEGQKIEIMPR